MQVMQLIKAHGYLHSALSAHDFHSTFQPLTTRLVHMPATVPMAEMCQHHPADAYMLKCRAEGCRGMPATCRGSTSTM